MKAFNIQSKTKESINCAILSKPTKERSKNLLGFDILGDFSVGYVMTYQHVFPLSIGIIF